jgi:hypothetical protein
VSDDCGFVGGGVGLAFGLSGAFGFGVELVLGDVGAVFGFGVGVVLGVEVPGLFWFGLLGLAFGFVPFGFSLFGLVSLGFVAFGVVGLVVEFGFVVLGVDGAFGLCAPGCAVGGVTEPVGGVTEPVGGVPCWVVPG